MKLNFKRILFIVLCAELLIIYWAHLELWEPVDPKIVYNKQPTVQPPDNRKL